MTKYVVLTVFVVLLPLLSVNDYGTGQPWFCKFICPAGTLEGGVPLAIVNAALRRQLGLLFDWKAGVLLALLIASVFVPRFFCRYLCPLGAIYGLLNRVSLYQMRVVPEKCVDCGACERVCPMDVDARKQINGTECIRCGACKTACPTHAIESGVRIASWAAANRKASPSDGKISSGSDA